MRHLLHVSVPGRGATEVFGAVAPEQKATGHYYHEEIAYTVAHGASLSGAPAFAYLKSHGIAKAMNSVIASLHTGVGAPFVILSFEDNTGSSSDHPFNAYAMLKSVGAEVLASGGSRLAPAVRRAFTVSTRGRKPVFVSVKAEETSTPGFLDGLREEIESMSADMLAAPTPVERYQGLLNPLLSSRFLGEDPPIPECPAGLPPRLRVVAEKYEPAIEHLKSQHYDWVTGDAGTTSLFGLPPHHLVDVDTHMGSALPLAIGASLSGAGRVLAVVGDFSFVSTGAVALTEAIRRQAAVDLVIFCNGWAAATGDQEVPISDVRRQIPVEVPLVECETSGLLPALSAARPSGPRVVLLRI